MKKLIEKSWHIAFVMGHASYFGMVFIEGHSIYAVIAGMMAITVVIGAIFHLGE